MDEDDCAYTVLNKNIELNKTIVVRDTNKYLIDKILLSVNTIKNIQYFIK